MSYQCEMFNQLAQTTLTIRSRCAVQDLPKVLPQTYKTIGEYLAQVGQQPAGAPFVAYYNEDMQNLDIEAGVPVAKKVAGKGDIQSGSIPALKAASCLYVGPYDGMPSAYEALMAWMKDQGVEIGGPCYEVYLNDPMSVPPEALQTRIIFPIKGK